MPNTFLTLAFALVAPLAFAATGGSTGPDALPSAANSDQQTVCGTMPPAGWITVSINGICARSGSTQLIGRTIRRIDTKPAGSTLAVCGDMPPAGWITTDISNSYCAQIGTTYYIGRTIQNIAGSVTGKTLKVCGDMPPSGWITTDISNTYCATLGYTSYIGRTIQYINGSATGKTLTVCGDTPPSGWITTDVSNSYCAKLGYTSYIGRTIQNIAGSATGKTLKVCGDVPPSGWITTAVSNTYCAQISSSYYIERTIRKIEGAPAGTQLAICGDAIPSGWTIVTVASQPCARLGTASYIGRTIKKLTAFRDAEPTPPIVSGLPRDLDGDGKDDLLAAATWRSSADGSTRSIEPAAAAQASVVLAANWLGDSRSILAFAATAPNEVHVVDAEGRPVAVETFPSDSPVASVVAADWDGDGKADLTVFRASASSPESGEFVYHPSSNADDEIRIAFGRAGALPVAADFDGDSQPDLATFDPASGTWLIRASSIGGDTTLAMPANTSNAIPLAADFDGDGKADPALLADGQLLVQLSSEGFRVLEAVRDAKPALADLDGDGRPELSLLLANGDWTVTRPVR